MSGGGGGTPAIARHVADGLRGAGCELVFGVPGGGSNLDVVGAAEAAGCRFVLAHTETAATIMAAVAAELTGSPCASVVTRGPGAASAVNGVAQALLDRQPVVLVSDCVTAGERDRVSHQRLDHRALFAPVAKASVVVGAGEAAAAVAAALATAVGGRPGPVHLDLDPTAASAGYAAPAPSAAGSVDERALAAAETALRAARRPVVVAGVGVVAAARDMRAGTVAALRRLVERTGVPALTTYKARGAVPDSWRAAAGVATGATIEAPVLEEADLVLGVGLDPVELIPAPWPYQAAVVLVGSWPVDDSTFFGDRVVAEVVGDMAVALDRLAPTVRSDADPATGEKHRQAANDRLLRAVPAAAPAGVVPQDVVTIARGVAPPGTIATVDAGAHMLPTVPLWQVEEPGELLISSGLATMGFALPAAVAAALVHPDRHVLCFTGDGGLGMALAELETVARLGLRIVVVVFDDASLSLIAIKQRREGHGGERAVRYAPVDFAGVAAACGLEAQRVDDTSGYEAALRKALGRDGPTLLDVSVDPGAYPALLEAIRGGRRSG